MGSEYRQERKDFRQSRVLASPNRFKLATFGYTTQGGSTITKVPGTADTDWNFQVNVSKLSEAAKIEALIPGARWKGYGGATDFQGRSYETLAWAAGIAAVTQTAQVFATVHFTTIHPVRLAKMIATIDHIAKGRLAINWVAGWNADEIAMFGGTQREHDERYDFADDYLALLNQMFEVSGTSDYHGKYFNLDGLYSEPKPIQSPRPVYMGAGFSPRGRHFAGEQCDINFVASNAPPDAMRGIIADTKQASKTHGRDVQVFGHGTIVCADTEQEARDYFEYVVTDQGDFEAGENVMRSLFATTKDSTGAQRGAMPPEVHQRMLKAMMGTHGGALLIGTPTQVVEKMKVLSDAGMDGMCLSWLHFEDGLKHFKSTLLPLMIDAGLRVDEPDVAGGEA